MVTNKAQIVCKTSRFDKANSLSKQFSIQVDINGVVPTSGRRRLVDMSFNTND